MSNRKQAIARRFGNAAAGYDDAATIQLIAARRLAALVADAGLPAAPRVLEIGCGTGLLTRRLRLRLPDADWTATDLSEGMVRHCLTQVCRTRLGPRDGIRFLVMDGENPAIGPGFDLICGGLAMQWFHDRHEAFRALAALLNPGGLLALSTLCDGSFAGWRSALRDEAQPDPTLDHPTARSLQEAWPAGGAGSWQFETLLERHERGIDFLRSLRAIGADMPRAGDPPPLDPFSLRRVLRRFEAEHESIAEYRIGYGIYRRQAAPSRPHGVFVTGTDTGVGKTLVSACLVRAWDAVYWKPLQTGLADEAGDTATVATLAELPPERIIAPAVALQAPLSPSAAAALESIVIDTGAIALPAATAAPLVVEGAGGLMVPVAGETMMIDLISRLGLPVVLVARGTLGTINHTLLSLEALRARGIPVAGVVISGPCGLGNRLAIEQHGKVRIIAELPAIACIDPNAVRDLAKLIPPFDSIGEVAGTL